MGHSILVAAYHILNRQVPYHDLGGDWYVKRRREAHARKLIKQLNDLGYRVTLDPIAA